MRLLRIYVFGIFINIFKNPRSTKGYLRNLITLIAKKENPPKKNNDK